MLGRGPGVDRDGVNSADDLLGELLLERRDLRTLNHHPRGEDGINGGPLPRSDHRLGHGDELVRHQASTS